MLGAMASQSMPPVAAAELEAIATEHDDLVWADYVARGPSDPRDMTAAEVTVCLNSSDPDKQRAVRAHLEALQADLDAGKGIRTTPRELMAGIRAELGLEPR